MQKNQKKCSKKNRWFYYINSAPELRNDKKSPMSRRFRICVAKGIEGVEGVLGYITGGRSLPCFKKKKCICGVTQLKKNMGKSNLWWASSIFKTSGTFSIVTPHNFADGSHLVALNRLWATKTGIKLLFRRSIYKTLLTILRGVRSLLTQWDVYVNSMLHCVIQCPIKSDFQNVAETLAVFPRMSSIDWIYLIYSEWMRNYCEHYT